MSNEQCKPCTDADHDNCPWAAGLCPVCGPTGCLDDNNAAQKFAETLGLEHLLTPELRDFDCCVSPAGGHLKGCVNAPGVPLKDHPYVWPDLPTLTDAMVDRLLAEVEALPSVSFTTQDEFLTALADLLDGSLHPDTCSIDADGTYCNCYIAKVREALPQCLATKPGHGRWQGAYWQCVRTAHPASPERHVFGDTQSRWV